MASVAAVALAIWFGGALLRWPPRLRLGLIVLLWAVVVLAHLVLPAGAALRVATGGRVEPWLVIGGLAVMVVGYRALLAGLRARVAARAVPVTAPVFSDAELERYSRHIVLREIGGAGQKRLKAARVLVVGAGGLGSPVVLYLAAGGVGTIAVVDDDTVDASNLQRQILHSDARIGMAKVDSARQAALALNPFVTLRPIRQRLTEETAAAIIAGHDLVLDGCDNFATRALVNRICVAQGIPLVSGAIAQWEGQVSLFDPAAGGPCLACVFPQAPAPGLAPACAEAGVAAPLPGIIGSIMALEAIKHLTGAGEGLRGRLLIHDALFADSRTIAIPRRADCPVCGTH